MTPMHLEIHLRTIFFLLALGLFTPLSVFSFTNTTMLEPITGMEFILIPAGCFSMGTPRNENILWGGDPDEKPPHEVCLDSYYIGKYEVTTAQWQIIKENKELSVTKGDGTATMPINQVSWVDANDFTNQMNLRISGFAVRLPTEAEWEYAARGGSKDNLYAGGNNIDNLAWQWINSGQKRHPVGTKASNGFGLYDISGNVYEWVSDWYSKDFYSRSPQNNPTGPDSGIYKVARGGFYGDLPRECRITYRYNFSPEYRYLFTGFRLVAFPKPKE